MSVTAGGAVHDVHPLGGTRTEPESAARPIADSPLLLHSIGHFGRLPLDVVDLIDPDRLVEIGGEGGLFTTALVAWAEEHAADVLCVDPAPSSRLHELAHSSRLRLVEGHSPEALEEVEPCGVYILDGDHNYYVVRRELDVIARQTFDEGRDTLVILHDVGWPCARRDFYYEPDRLPHDAVAPYSFEKGISPRSEVLTDFGGLSGAGVLAIAEVSGGDRNGVLTAVEDFCADRDELELLVVPSVYGLGFLFPSRAEWAPALRSLLAPHAGSELLAGLEANRVALFIRVLELQADLELGRRGYERAIEGYESRIAELTAENLRLKIAERSLGGRADD